MEYELSLFGMANKISQRITKRHQHVYQNWMTHYATTSLWSQAGTELQLQYTSFFVADTHGFRILMSFI